MKVMVVDDEKDVELLFIQQFRKEIKKGIIKLDFTFSAEQALEYLESKITEGLVLILADINMPGMNGLELLKVIKETFPHLKVFIITAYGDEHNYQTAKQYGADAYMNKPIEFEKLKKEILNF